MELYGMPGTQLALTADEDKKTLLSLKCLVSFAENEIGFIFMLVY